MSRPNSHSITKATDFVKQLFKKEETKITTKEETQPATTLVLSDRDSSKKDKKKVEKYHRADTAVGIMNKFILQFSKVEQAYREIEKAFLAIVKTNADQAQVQDKFKRKCEVKKIRPILEYLGYPEFTDSELKQIFNKDVTSNDQITFKRLLVGSGLCYYEKQPKKKQLNFVRKGKKNNDKASADSDYETDDEKMIANTPSIDEDDLIVDPQAARRRRFRHIQQGFDVVKKMFDKIDDDASGEITHSEFKQAFMDICRDPEIVDARMAELDYNKDQEITFREFIFGIASWVGFNDQEGDDDEYDPIKDDEDGKNLQKLENNVSSNSVGSTDVNHANSNNNDNSNNNNNKNENVNGNGSNNNGNHKKNISNGKMDANSVQNDSATNDDSTDQTKNPDNTDNKNDDNDNDNDHEPTVTETEDASFFVKKDVGGNDNTENETNIEKTYKIVEPKNDGGSAEHSQGGKDASVDKSASRELTGPPSSYMD